MCPMGSFRASFVIVTPLAQLRMRPLALLNLCFAVSASRRNRLTCASRSLSTLAALVTMQTGLEAVCDDLPSLVGVAERDQPAASARPARPASAAGSRPSPAAPRVMLNFAPR